MQMLSPTLAPTHPPLGADLYRTLPGKTLHLLRYALSSSCRYTHILKTDDDVYLRPQVAAPAVRTSVCA
jgi:hypothetical protein